MGPYEIIPLTTVRKGKTLIPHFLCAEEAEIYKHDRDAPRGQLPRPCKAIAQLIILLCG
jgi:hypothetical protein